MSPAINKVSASDLKQQMENSEQCQVIDVRELAEVEAEHIPGVKVTPLSELEKHHDSLTKGHHLYVVCRTGRRAQKAAEKLQQAGYEDIHVVDGGLEAWKSAGFDVKQGDRKVWSLERQVRFAAGLFVLVGVLLGWLVNPSFYLVPAFVAGGLMFAAATDTCAMAQVLLKMPWNR